MVVNPFTKQTFTKRRGKRSGAAVRAARERDIHSRLDGKPSGSHSNHSHNINGNVSNFKATVTDNSVYYDCGEVETREDHVVPRRSITDREMLRIFPVEIETESRVCRQLDKSTDWPDDPIKSFRLEYIAGTWYLLRMVVTTDERLVWKSDQNLLNRKPTDKIGTFKREGSIGVGLNRRKTIITKNEDTDNITPEIPVVDDQNITDVTPYTGNISSGGLKPVLPKLDF